jgi:hypothetical protein
MKRTLGLLLIALVAGCHPTTPPTVPPTTPQQPTMSPSSSSSSKHEPLKLMQKGDASMTSTVASTAERGPNGLRVEIYQLQVPDGTVSRNERFWKHIDEHSLDPATYDLLYRNGVRVGQAPLSDWEYFKQVMDQYPAVTRATSLVAAESKPIELSMRKDVPMQDICFFDSTNKLEGRSYISSENIVALTFQQAPRRIDTMRVALCPVVRSVRKRLELTPLNNEQEVSFTYPEHLYNMNLRADVQVDSFLVVAPSEEARWASSIGNNFFVSDGKAERLENVLLIVPRGVRIEQVITPKK